MTRARLLIAILVAVAGCAGKHAAPAEAPRAPLKKEAQLEFDAAVRLIRLGPESYPAALERLAATRRADPTLWEAWFDEGVILLEQRKAAEAASAFDKALSIAPNEERIRRALATARIAQGRLDDAEKVLRAGLPAGDPAPLADTPPQRARRVALALVVRKQGRLDDAAAELRKVLRVEPRSAPALTALGALYRDKAQPELSELVLRRALEVEPGRAATWNDLGLTLFAERRDAESFAAFEKAAALDGSLVEARYNLASAYLDSGDYAAAARELSRLTEARPDLVDGWIALGVAERGQRRYPESRRAYRKALSLDEKGEKAAAALYDLAVLEMDFAKDSAAAREALSGFLRIADARHPKRADADSRARDLDRAVPAPPAH